MSFSARFQGIVSVPIFEAPYVMPHVQGGGAWATSPIFGLGTYEAALQGRLRKKNTFVGLSGLGFWAQQFDYQSVRAWSKSPTVTNGNAVVMNMMPNGQCVGYSVIGVNGDYAFWNFQLPTIAPSADVTINFIPQPVTFSLGVTSNFADIDGAQVYLTHTPATIGRFEPSVLYAANLTPFLRIVRGGGSASTLAAAGALVSSTVIQKVDSWSLVPLNNGFTSLMGSPRNDVSPDNIYACYCYPGSVNPITTFVFSNPDGSTSPMQARAIQNTLLCMLSSCSTGHLMLINAAGTGPTGAAFEVVFVAPDLTRWWCLKLMGLSASARQYLALINAASSLKVDRLGYIWYIPNNSGSATDKIFSSFALNFIFNPRLFAVTLPPLELECYTPCQQYLIGTDNG